MLLEIIGILAFFVALIVGFKLLHWAVELLKDQEFIDENLLPYVAFLLLFAAIVIGFNLMGKALKKVLDMTFFGTFDSLAGAIIGLFKWALAISVLIWLLTALEIQLPPDSLSGSRVYPILEPFAPLVFNTLGEVFPTAESLIRQVQAQN